VSATSLLLASATELFWLGDANGLLLASATEVLLGDANDLSLGSAVVLQKQTKKKTCDQTYPQNFAQFKKSLIRYVES
jgi:hypothetical protein